MKKAIAAVIAAFLLSSCSGSGRITSNPPPDDYVKGEILFLKGEFIRAAELFTRFIERNNRSPFVSDASYWAGVCALKLGDTAEARRLISKTYSRPRTKQMGNLALTSLADCDYEDALYSSALKRYRKALKAEHAPKDRINYRIGLCNARLGRRKEADTYFKSVLEKYPDSGYSKMAKERIGFSGSGGNYSIQAGAFSSNKNAEQLRAQLARRGFSPFIHVINRVGEVLYAVRIGHFDTQSKALSVLKQLKAAGFDGAVIP